MLFPKLTSWQQQQPATPESKEAAADLLFFLRKSYWNCVPLRSSNICNVLNHDLNSIIILKLCTILHKTMINNFC